MDYSIDDIPAGANGTMPFKLGSIDSLIIGGPYRNKPFGLIGINMAEEIEKPSTYHVMTRDFSVPDVTDLRRGLMAGIVAMAQRKTLYVGCAGGIGRTGLYLAMLAKLMGIADPVAYVREHYIPHAVETKHQQEYVASLRVDDLARWSRCL